MSDIVNLGYHQRIVLFRDMEFTINGMTKEHLDERQAKLLDALDKTFPLVGYWTLKRKDIIEGVQSKCDCDEPMPNYHGD